MEDIEFGYVKGELCSRDGCTGIIDEREKEGSCSCHINPPCSYCTTDTNYCPVCGWEPEDKEVKISEKTLEYYRKSNEEWTAQRNLFYKKYSGEAPIEKLEMRIEPHTHFSQKVVGVFPKGTESQASLWDQVKGTFGGRFSRFTDYSFEYIAYTD